MIRVNVQRVGGIANKMKRVGGEVGFASHRIGGISTATERLGGMDVRTYRRGGILCRMYQEVRSSLGGAYLEISPTVVWVLAGWTSNDVFSNTTWNIE